MADVAASVARLAVSLRFTGRRSPKLAPRHRRSKRRWRMPTYSKRGSKGTATAGGFVEVSDVAPVVGLIALQMVPFEGAFTPALEVCWRLRPDYWDAVYATEGAAAALHFAFEKLGKNEVVASTAAILHAFAAAHETPRHHARPRRRLRTSVLGRRASRTFSIVRLARTRMRR